MTIDTVALRSPDALLASLPYLIGFTPRDSVVVVWLRGAGIVLTQRIDWPAGGGRAKHREAWLGALLAPTATTDADEVVVVLVGPATDRDAELMPTAELAGWIEDGCRQASLPVRDLLHLHGVAWRSLLCVDEGCCPPSGRAVDDSVRVAVAAEFTAAGQAPLDDRADVVASLSTDDATVALLAGQVAAARRPDDGIEEWRDRTIEGLLRAVDGAPDQPVGEAGCALAIAGLRDVRVRDTALWEITMRGDSARDRALVLLITALRGCERADAPAVATTLAVVAWLLGDGARAAIAIDRALAIDPQYSLAILMQRSLAAGLPPRHWVEAMQGLSRMACRHGS